MDKKDQLSRISVIMGMYSIDPKCPEPAKTFFHIVSVALHNIATVNTEEHNDEEGEALFEFLAKVKEDYENSKVASIIRNEMKNLDPIELLAGLMGYRDTISGEEDQKNKTVVRIVERGKGWDPRIIDKKEFDSFGEAQAFCIDYNKDLPDGPVPDHYIQAEIVN